MDALKITKLKKQFGKNPALIDISFTVKQGEIFGFLGPNGAGKSTTLRCIMDTISPNSGTIKIFGKDANQEKTTAELKKDIGYVPAEPNLYPSWTVDRHIKFAEKLYAVDSTKSTKLKKLLSIDGNKKVGTLSTGNHQKLAIILALIHSPKLLILDEPTRGLDPLFRASLHKLLKDYQKEGGTILLSSHDLYEVEELCDRVAIIKNGQIVDNTSLDKLRGAGAHSIKITFTKSIPRELTKLNMGDYVKTRQTVSFTLKGSLDPLLKILSVAKVQELNITSPTLEDIFKEIYV